MINKKYENVQAVVRDFRLIFSTFRHISQVSNIKIIYYHNKKNFFQQSNSIQCKLMMDFLERHFNECLRKYFRGWNLDKYRPGVIDIL
jgi:phage pi2 protein 07